MKLLPIPKSPSTRNSLTGFVFCFMVVGLFYYIQSSTATVTYSLTFDSLVVEGDYGDRIPFAALQQVTLREEPPINPIQKAGITRGKLLQGVFTTDDLGDAQLYINTAKPPFVLIKTLDRVILINGKDRAATEDLYHKLAQALQATET